MQYASVRLTAVLLSVCLLAGCITTGLHETARTTPPGKFEFGGAVTPMVYTFDSVGRGFSVVPFSELYGKVGLGDNFDMGLHWAAGPGLGIDGKYRFVSGPVDVAARLAASLYGMYATGSSLGMYSIMPRVVASGEPEAGMPWMVNVGVDYDGVFGNLLTGGDPALFLRAGVGVPFRLLGSVRIMPELDAFYSLSPDASSVDDGSTVISVGGSRMLILGVTVGSVARDENSEPGWQY